MSDIELPPEAPPVPSRRNDTQPVFDAKSDAYLNWQGVFRDWFEPFIAWVSGLRTTVIDARDQALTSATAAATAADAAAGAANFAGLWPSLSGELLKPATVKNGGRFWLLLQDLADVAAHEPAEGPYWTARDAGVITRRVTENEVATFGVVHALMVPGITLQVPGNPLDSDFVEIANASGATVWLEWSGKTINNQVPRSPMAMPPGARIRVYWYAAQETWA